jgi:hypothetical protein
MLPPSTRRSLVALTFLASPLLAQQWIQKDTLERTNKSIFRAIDAWPAPNDYRTGGGKPGHRYWQQRVDYSIRTSLDTVEHVVSGSERITYHNNSPDPLSFVWVQLDQNVDNDSTSPARQAAAALPERISPEARRFLGVDRFDGGYRITRVQLVNPRTGAKVDARYLINNTVMKVQLGRAVPTGGTAVFEIDWRFRVPDIGSTNNRGGREKVRDGWLYEMAQWFPRLAVYDDINGWQTDQFMGQGEFYLEFGNYDVAITVPADHLVEASGLLQNALEVLTPTQRARLAEAYRSETPRFIVRPDEVMTAASRPKSRGMLTWRFKADNVRDFAWASSKTFVWDAAGFKYRPTQVPIQIHSFYPRDAMPLWDKVSTKAAIQTMRTYGRLAFEYPYPKAANVHGPIFGMEYPMVAFCGARPNPDGSFTDALERALISVTIHEVGHNWFPMVVASDERKWTWMDEGINSFLQYYAELDWDASYPTRRGPAKNIVGYMRDADQVPLMTESDIIHKDFGNNGYSKPAAGLVMLREHVLGPARFDEAFREYSQAWMFKKPQPVDFFRAMEEGAGDQLNWFWRGWFYTTHFNDQAIVSVAAQPADSVTGSTAKGRYYYRASLENKGGLVMPLDLEIGYDDGTTGRIQIPVDAWRFNEKRYLYGFFTNKTVVRVVVDPDEKFADVDRTNNTWVRPSQPVP